MTPACSCGWPSWSGWAAVARPVGGAGSEPQRAPGRGGLVSEEGGLGVDGRGSLGGWARLKPSRSALVDEAGGGNDRRPRRKVPPLDELHNDVAEEGRVLALHDLRQRPVGAADLGVE